MMNEEYQVALTRLGLIASTVPQLFEGVDLDRMIQTMAHSDDIGPFLHTTIWQRNGGALRAQREFAQATKVYIEACLKLGAAMEREAKAAERFDLTRGLPDKQIIGDDHG